MPQTVNELLGPVPQGQQIPSVDSVLGPLSGPSSAVLPPWERIPLGLASAGARGIAYGLGAPGDLERLAVQGVNRVFGTNEPVDQGHLFWPTSETMLDVAQRAGLTGYPQLAPQSTLERLGQAGVTGLGAAAPLLMAGQPPIPTLAAGAAGGTAAQGAAELGAPPGVQLAVGLGAGLAGAGASRAGLAAFTRTPSHVASDLGTSETLQQAGIALQDSARDWTNQLPNKLKSIWSPVDEMIPRETGVPVTNFKSSLDAITTSAGSLAPLERLLRPALPERLRSALIDPITEDVRLGPASWNDVQKLRSTLGDAMSNPKIIQDIGQENLSRLYASVTADMRGAAGQTGDNALQAFDRANAESTRLYGIAEGPMSRIIAGSRPSADDPAPELVANRLLAAGRRGGSDLQVLRSEIPDAVDELGAAHLRLDPSGVGWSRLSPEAQVSLVPDSRDRAVLDAALPVRGKSELTRIGEHQLGLWLGNAIGSLAGHFVAPGLSPYVAGAVGELGGAAAPWMWRAARGAVTNPLAVAPGLLGAAAQPSMQYTIAQPQQP